MTVRGRIEPGVVVLARTHVLTEGTKVEVLALSPPKSKAGEAMEKLAGTARTYRLICLKDTTAIAVNSARNSAQSAFAGRSRRRGW